MKNLLIVSLGLSNAYVTVIIPVLTHTSDANNPNEVIELSETESSWLGEIQYEIFIGKTILIKRDFNPQWRFYCIRFQISWKHRIWLDNGGYRPQKGNVHCKSTSYNCLFAALLFNNTNSSFYRNFIVRTWSGWVFMLCSYIFFLDAYSC